jgi:hypothetical protein
LRLLFQRVASNTQPPPFDLWPLECTVILLLLLLLRMVPELCFRRHAEHHKCICSSFILIQLLLLLFQLLFRCRYCCSCTLQTDCPTSRWLHPRSCSSRIQILPYHCTTPKSSCCCSSART